MQDPLTPAPPGAGVVRRFALASLRFSVAGVYLTDPLRKSNAVNRALSSVALRTTMNYRWRFQRYLETDSPYDDLYTPGYRPAKDEWYGRFVVVLPIR
jgi:hypothetical protein